MPQSHKISAALMTVISAVGFYLFFALKYPYHLHFQEQYQLFEATWAYFASVTWVPGGLADWLGRFVTQFFYYAPLGACLLALLLCGVQLLTFAACKEKTLFTFALSFIPSFLLVAFLCDENALLGGIMAILFSLAGAALCQRIRKDLVRHITEAVLVPLLYMACGGLAVVFILISAIREGKSCGTRSIPVSLAMVLLAVLCPIVASHLFPYPLERLAYGVHYFRYHNLLPGLLWLAALGTVPVVLVSVFRCFRQKALPGVAAWLALGVLGTVLVFRTADGVKEEWMRYDFMVRMQMWNRIMMQADAKNPDNPKTVSCLNLALAKTGRMPDSQFSYYQNGPEGLLPEFVGDHTNPMATGEIYWHLGMVNTAQRFAFEAQEAIPDFQKSARLYKRLAETNIVNGDADVARKYLKALSHTFFYRQWALETTALLDAGEIFDHRPELARARDLRLKEHDFLFSGTEMDSMLGLLKVENSQNSMALDYLMAWNLLRKDLDRFVECIGMVEEPMMPKSYQEALLLRWVQTHNDFEGLPGYLAPAHARRINSFILDMKAGKSEEKMRKDYGDTYWFYYYFRYLKGE